MLYRVTCYTDITPQHIPFMTPFITRDHYSLYTITIHRRNNQYNSFTSLTHQSLSSFIHPSSHRHRLLLLSLLYFIGGFYYWQFAFIFAFLLHILMVGYMSARSLFLQYYLYSIHHTLPPCPWSHGIRNGTRLGRKEWKEASLQRLTWSLKCMFMDVFSNTGWDIIIYGNMVSCLCCCCWAGSNNSSSRPDLTRQKVNNGY